MPHLSQAQASDPLKLTKTPSLIPLPSWLTIPNLPPNVATIVTLLYAIFYILLEPVAGTMVVPIIFGFTAYGNHMMTTAPDLTTKVSAAVFVASWVAQFLGHGVFEKRAPALLDNLLQALVLAPFFVWMEILFKFGYRPELQSRVEKAVEKELAKEKAAKANGAAKNGATK